MASAALLWAMVSIFQILFLGIRMIIWHASGVGCSAVVRALKTYDNNYRGKKNVDRAVYDVELEHLGRSVHCDYPVTVTGGGDSGVEVGDTLELMYSESSGKIFDLKGSRKQLLGLFGQLAISIAVFVICMVISVYLN